MRKRLGKDHRIKVTRSADCRETRNKTTERKMTKTAFAAKWKKKTISALK